MTGRAVRGNRAGFISKRSEDPRPAPHRVLSGAERTKVRQDGCSLVTPKQALQ